MLLMLLCGNNFSRYRIDKFYQKEVKRYTEKEPRNTHKMFWDKEYNEDNRCRYIEGFTNQSWIEKISFYHVYDKKHHHNGNNNTPTWIDRNTRKNYWYTSYKHSENWDKTGEKGDTSKS